ncbi:hypothetical protein AwDysgo_07690 [Bacteroidales bacterium]|nr:hypothetical protein AwDysgo_07690 [Bacteroidales bacterium]
MRDFYLCIIFFLSVHLAAANDISTNAASPSDMYIAILESSKIKKEADNIFYDKPDSIITYDYVGNAYHKTTFKYDKNGNEAEVIEYDKNDQDLTMQAVYRSEYTYDLNDNIVSQILYNWDKNDKKWVFNSKSSIETNKLESKKISQYLWGENRWNLVAEIEQYNYYSSQNKIDSSYLYARRVDDYISVIKTMYYYQEDGLNSTSVSSIQEGNKPWANLLKNLSIYDENKNLLTLIDSMWNKNLESWVPSIKKGCKYDMQNRPVLDESYMWFDKLGVWIGVKKMITDYNYDGTTNEKSFFNFNIAINTWNSYRNGYEVFYYDKKNTTNIGSESISSKAKIWTNGTMLYVEEGRAVESIKIFSLSGELLLNKTPNNSLGLNLSGLNSRGVCIVKLTFVDASSQTQKIFIH